VPDVANDIGRNVTGLGGLREMSVTSTSNDVDFGLMSCGSVRRGRKGLKFLASVINGAGRCNRILRLRCRRRRRSSARNIKARPVAIASTTTAMTVGAVRGGVVVLAKTRLTVPFGQMRGDKEWFAANDSRYCLCPSASK
jgi:hypothetical protein